MCIRDRPKATQAVIQTPSVGSLDAEIRWALKMVTMHAFFRSCLNLNELFSTMFPDSDIATNFKMSKTKAAYLINYGIADQFH